MLKLAFCALFLGATISVAAGINCYDCTWSIADTSCYDAVENATKSDCGNRFCSTVRGELESQMVSFQRGCIDVETNDEREISGLKVITRSCNTDLCNNGDGTSRGASLTGMLSATIIGVAVALKQVL